MEWILPGRYDLDHLRSFHREICGDLLPDPRFGATRYIGAYWTRAHDVEVDLVDA